jgi:exonuclease III
MPVFGKPRFRYDYDVDTELAHVDEFFLTLPDKRANEIDLATWNIANLGPQKRRPRDLELIAHILSKWDIIAVQEVRAQLGHFESIMEHLDGYAAVFTDVAGNEERLAVVYREDVVAPGPLTAELDYNPNGSIKNGQYIVPRKRQSFRLSGRTIETFFQNFNRNPFLTTWEINGSNTSFMLANVHAYFGATEKKNAAKFKNRIAEIYFMADWAKEMQRASNRAKVYERNVIMLGDMNVPTMASDDPVYRALKRRGFRRTQYSSEAGTTIQEFTAYDQIVFANENIRITEIDGFLATVFDFDNFVFKDLWEDVEAGRRTLTQFKAWTKFAVSDHRPVFVRMRV